MVWGLGFWIQTVWDLGLRIGLVGRAQRILDLGFTVELVDGLGLGVENEELCREPQLALRLLLGGCVCEREG